MSAIRKTLQLAPLLLALLWSACADTHLSGVGAITYSGMYVLTRVNDQPLPVAVTTSVLNGGITSGGLEIDEEASYWLRIDVHSAATGPLQYQGRGTAMPGSAGSINFLDRDGASQWIATKEDTLLIIPDLAGIRAQFRWVGPYRRRQ